MSKRLICGLVSAFLFTAAASAAPLSPALDMLRARMDHTKTVSAEKPTSFSRGDFREAVGVDVERIVIKTLPHTGVLKFGVDEVAAGAVIDSSELSALRFLPFGDGEDTSFTFSTDPYSQKEVYTITLTCDSSLPTAEKDMELVTFKAMPVSGRLGKPDGGASYHVLSSPKKGTLTFSETGEFTYTPRGGFTGKDSFTYCIRNASGKQSESATVTLRVRRPWRNLAFSDMAQDPAHAAAVMLVEKGVCDISYDVSGKPVFFPDDVLTRAEFVSWVVKAVGIRLDDHTGEIREVFADASSTPVEFRTALAAAIDLGYIKGREGESGHCLFPDEPITLGEAALILERAVGIEPSKDSLPVSGTPDWCADAVGAIREMGLVLNASSHSHLLTRADAALIISRII